MKPIQIGDITLKNNAILAPMSGVTDAPFRKLAHEMGAGLVVSEMVASEELAKANMETLRRTEGVDAISPLSIQLAGRDAKWMAEGAKMAEDLGADIIDINMGCPARKVVSGLSGSALMREPELALSLVEATVNATSKPVTLKMRLGWDYDQLNAPMIAKRAEELGIQLITVHGRTRNQFYKGEANWDLIRETKEAISIPLIANGDLTSHMDAPKMLKKSGADGVMVGRGAYGQPWLVGDIGEFLKDGKKPAKRSYQWQKDLVLRHFDMMIEHYEPYLGVRISRKHIGWYLENNIEDAEMLKIWRKKIMTLEDEGLIKREISNFFDQMSDEIGEADE